MKEKCGRTWMNMDKLVIISVNFVKKEGKHEDGES